MKLSLSWLRELVDLDGLSVEEIGHQLTMKTALIEEIEVVGDALADVKVGHVLEASRHPDADKLSVCQVNVGSESPYQIICGAPNVAAGQRVAVALPGSTLPGDFKIQKRKLRGVASHGMICSAQELELGDDHDGIMVLDAEATIGSRLVDHLDLIDHVYEIDNKSITHRPDLWGHLGFARELAAIFSRRLKPFPVDETLKAGEPSVPVEIADDDLCGRYLALTIRGLTTCPSPEVISRRLTACGVRPISLAVDLSNYIMLEIGQPTHPFDERTLQGGRIIVRRAREGEVLKTLDDAERHLTKDMLVIADENRGIALGGVMGGLDSEVTDSTQDVVLEAASFDAVNIRATSSALGLRTDAVARFEKFLDPHLAELAVRRYATLVRQYCPEAQVEGTFRDAGKWTYEPSTVSLRPSRLRKKLGLELSLESIRGHLESLDFGVEGDEERLQVAVPSSRATRDITIEDDLIEEVGRIHGYENVEATLPRVSCAPPTKDPMRELENEITGLLVDRCSMIEVLDYSMVDDRSFELAGADANEEFLRLRNPVTADTKRMRRSLVPGMLRFLRVNEKNVESYSMFQIGRSYWPERSNDEGLPWEKRELVAVEVSPAGDYPGMSPALSRLKGRVEVLFRELGFEPTFTSATEDLSAWCHPSKTVVISIGGVALGTCGEIHPEVGARLGDPADVAVLDVDLSALMKRKRRQRAFEPIPKFPPVKIDLALIAGFETTIDDILREIRKANPKLIREVELFDVFIGKQVPEGKRSLAFRITFRSDERTLKDTETVKARDKIVARLQAMGLELR